MGQAPFTERHSKALKNSLGLSLELERSKEFHQDKIPLLVSSSLLRSRDMGQIDLAGVYKKQGEWLMEIAEVKSSQVGEENFLRSQRKRLNAAQGFLSGLLGMKSKLTKLVG